MPASTLPLDTRISIIKSAMPDLPEAVVQAIRHANGDITTALAAMPDALCKQFRQPLELTDAVATAMSDCPEVAAKIAAGLLARGVSRRDIAATNVDTLTQIMVPILSATATFDASAAADRARQLAAAISKEAIAREVKTAATGTADRGTAVTPIPRELVTPIASMGSDQFVQEHAQALGADGTAKATAVHRTATSMEAHAINLWTSFSQLTAPHTQTLPATRTAGAAAKRLLPDYETIFGNQAYCECEECKSIFGPAAYFVDLMRIAYKHITVSADQKAVMSLEARRPDLARIPLTCEKTNTLTPYLAIVNERLEEAVAKALSCAKGDVYLTLAKTHHPLELPFQLPLEQVRIYLQQMKTELADVYAVLGYASTPKLTSKDPCRYAWAAEVLGLSQEQWSLISSEVPQNDGADLKTCYGVADLPSLADPVTFCRQTGLGPAQFTQLLQQDLSESEIAAGIQKQFFINQRLADPIQVQSVGRTPQITSLVDGVGTLDRVHRFLRLARKLGWSYQDLDWALHCVNHGTPTISSDALVELARLVALARQLGMSIRDACSLVFDLQTYGTADGPSVFDRVFNGPGIDRYHPMDPGPQGYALNPTYRDPCAQWMIGSADQDTRRLAGLGLSSDDLVALAKSIFAGPTVPLTVSNLSLLYRHARLASLLTLPVPEYLAFRNLIGLSDQFTVSDVLDALDLAARLRCSGMRVYELQYVVKYTTGDPVRPEVDTFFNEGALESWREVLRKRIKPMPKLEPKQERVDDAQQAQITDAQQTVTSAVAALLGARPEQIVALLPDLCAAPLSDLAAANRAIAHIAAFLDPQNPQTAARIIRNLSRSLVIVSKLQLTIDELKALQSCPTSFGIAAGMSQPNDVSFLAGITARNVLDIHRMKQLRSAWNDAPGNVLAYLACEGEDEQARTKRLNALEVLMSWDRGQISSVLDRFGSDDSPIARLHHLRQVQDLCRQIGVDFGGLQQLLDLAASPAASWAKQTAAADHLLACVRASVGQAGWDRLFLQLEGRVQEAKRRALIGTAINTLAASSGTQWIANARNLSEYLLLDVEMGPGTQISYIKEGINAVQLYLQRCRERLEPGVTLDIPEPWWDWMLNYRIWEANRRIFLYPENYLDPALRPGKTQLFKDLEDNLAQGEITDATVTTAFTKYLESFAELARLRYVDSYYDYSSNTGDKPRFFFIARTETEPYKYHFITREADGLWSQWQEVKVTINADQVTLVRAFNRLFVFWVELKTCDEKSTTGGTTGNIRITKATIRYTFHNFSGDWVQPQTLVQDAIIAAEISSATGKQTLTPAPLFDADQPYWKRVHLLRFEKQKYLLPGTGGNRFEKLAILYGPTISIADQWPLGSTTGFPGELAARLAKVQDAWTQAKAGGCTGRLPIFPPLLIGDDLAPGFLLHPDEVLVIEQPSSNDYVRAQIDRGVGVLSLFPSSDSILDNYPADNTLLSAILQPTAFSSFAAGISGGESQNIFSALTDRQYLFAGQPVNTDVNKLRNDLPAILGVGSTQRKIDHVIQMIINAQKATPLSTAMRHQDYSVFAVRNHHTGFVFSGDRESFLLSASSAFCDTISSTVRNANTFFTDASFVSSNTHIQLQDSQRIQALLVQQKHLDSRGCLDPSLDLQRLLADLRTAQYTNDQIEVIANILCDRQLIAPETFITASTIDKSQYLIDKSLSNKIRNFMLRNPEGGPYYLDREGRLQAAVSLSRLADDLRSFLIGLEPHPSHVGDVYRRVISILTPPPPPCVIGCSAPALDAREQKYVAVRLTTAAVHRLSARLFTNGLDGLLSLASQQIPVEVELPFDRFGFSSSQVAMASGGGTPESAEGAQIPADGTQVDFMGAYGQYYWELFFHAPLHIANTLKRNQRFGEAQRWYKYVFDPTMPDDPMPPDALVASTIGKELAQRIHRVLRDKGILNSDGHIAVEITAATELDVILSSDPLRLGKEQSESVRNALLNNWLRCREGRFWQFEPFRNCRVESLQGQFRADAIERYNNDPFDAHAIAALRWGAYEKAVVMQYVDNLLSWGDMLFSEYSWDAIVAATVVYMYAYDLLGNRPENLGKLSDLPPRCFADILKAYQSNAREDPIQQFLIALEELQLQPLTRDIAFTPVNALDTYFGVPENDVFLGYWDRIEDRLYKIRHGLSLQGIPQNPELFERPMDPRQLIRAAAARCDVPTQITQTGILFPYRFSAIIERARSLASAVSSLGAELLATLEKKDGEQLALLRSSQQQAMAHLITLTKEKQIEESRALRQSLQAAQQMAQRRFDYYDGLYQQNMTPLEIADMTMRGVSIYPQVAAIAVRGISIGSYLMPTIYGLADGGMDPGNAISVAAQMQDGYCGVLNHVAGMLSTMAQYERRRSDWGLQRDLAKAELAQLDNQIAANQARLDLVVRELEAHRLSIAQEQEYERYLKSKFTNQELYQWMAGRLGAIYSQMYRLALDLFLAAQKAYQTEMDTTETFVADRWDDLRQGLLAGRALELAIERMHSAYLSGNTRRLEIEKTISLLHLNPIEFIRFRGGMEPEKKGTLSFELDEKLFDFDFPGQYCRKIKSVTVTIPAVIGPYQNLNATLTQTGNVIITKPEIETVKKAITEPIRPSEPMSVALSRGIADAGLFVVDHRDERLLPFEGSGVASTWELKLPPETNRIDFSTISDVILKIEYTAKYDGALAEKLRQTLRSEQPPYPYTPAKVLDLRQAFPADWTRFMACPSAGNVHAITFALGDPIILPNLQDVRLLKIEVALLTSNGTIVSDTSSGPFVHLSLDNPAPRPLPIERNLGSLELASTEKASTCTLQLSAAGAPAEILKDGRIRWDLLQNVIVVIRYESNVFSRAEH